MSTRKNIFFIPVLFLSLLDLQTALAGTLGLGKVEFLVDTNVKAFKFRGEAKDLQSTMDRAGTSLKHLELTIPVLSLKTGMDLRDKHMRERIFTKTDGSTPDIVFKADQVTCSPDCTVTGTLTLRGETRPQLLKLSMKDPNRVEGTAQIQLSKFGIDAPTQLGVKVSDNVDVHFDVLLK